MKDNESCEAIVEKVIRKGPHGPYAVASNEELGSITFSLDSIVWKEGVLPDPGTYVLLSQITKKRAGWRAGNGRFVRPSDAKQLDSKQSKRSTEQ